MKALCRFGQEVGGMRRSRTRPMPSSSNMKGADSLPAAGSFLYKKDGW